MFHAPMRPVIFTPPSSRSGLPRASRPMRREKNGTRLVVLIDAAELEDVGLLQEKRALFRKEQIEAGQVDLPRIGGGAREVRIDASTPPSSKA